MGKDIGNCFKHSQFQISTLSLKAPVISSSASQTSSAVELTTTSVPSVREKNQNNSAFCSQNTIQNCVSITNNNDIQYCEMEK